MYIEGESQDGTAATSENKQTVENVIDENDFVDNMHSSALKRALSANNSLASDSGIGAAHNDNRKLKVTLMPDKGYFLVGKASPAAQTYVLSITVSFARHLIRVRHRRLFETTCSRTFDLVIHLGID